MEEGSAAAELLEEQPHSITVSHESHLPGETSLCHSLIKGIYLSPDSYQGRVRSELVVDLLVS